MQTESTLKIVTLPAGITTAMVLDFVEKIAANGGGSSGVLKAVIDMGLDYSEYCKLFNVLIDSGLLERDDSNRKKDGRSDWRLTVDRIEEMSDVISG